MRKTNARFRHCEPGLPVAVFLLLLIPATACYSNDADRLEKARQRMISGDLIERGIRDLKVLAAMRTIPREQFVPKPL